MQWNESLVDWKCNKQGDVILIFNLFFPIESSGHLSTASDEKKRH